MWLIAGLGNPGAEYAATRHNIGFMAVDALANRAGVRSFSAKFQSEVATAELQGEKVILLKPQTYMNLSGKAVQAALAFYKLPPTQLVVLQDELDLPLGKLRIKKAGGANGHNGIKDIDHMIGPDYWRIRLGVGHPGTSEQVHDHVLGRFTKEEQPLLDKTLAALTEHFAVFWQHSPEALATKVAATLNPPPAKPIKKDQETDGI
jgi:PTH1 family peptidyl-tRNA hydrolase